MEKLINKMDITKLFKMPNPVTIAGRTSIITNSFVNGIVPCIVPTEDEIQEVLNILGMNTSIKCAYCGDTYTEWDHFRPLVWNKRPTGYISEIYNLVPSCGKCNQSKGNSYWKEWIYSDAKLSPKTRNIARLNEIVAKLEQYEKWGNPTRINFEEVVGKYVWEKHWKNCENLHEMMHESQKLSNEIKSTMEKWLLKDNEVNTPSIHKELTNTRNNAEVKKKIGVIVQTELISILEGNKVSFVY